MGFCTWRKLQINGERMEKEMSGKNNGGKVMVHLAKQRNGLTNGAALTQTHSSMLAMLMFGMKGTKHILYIYSYAALLKMSGSLFFSDWDLY